MITHVANWKQWICGVILIVVYVFALPNIHTGNQAIDSFVDRIVFDEDFFEENNRTIGAFDNAFDESIRNGSVWTGHGTGFSESLGGGTLSIKTDILDYGLLLTAIFYVPVLIVLIFNANGKIQLIAFILCYFVSLYQRPWLYEVSNYMLLIGAVAYLKGTEHIREELTESFTVPTMKSKERK